MLDICYWGTCADHSKIHCRNISVRPERILFGLNHGGQPVGSGGLTPVVQQLGGIAA
jgi:hypothetical protein